MSEASFSITAGKGFQIQLINGLTISVQFGPGNYCERRDKHWTEPGQTAMENAAWTSPNAEVAFFWRDFPGTWATKEVFKRALNQDIADDVVGYVTPNELLRLLDVAATLVREPRLEA